MNEVKKIRPFRYASKAFLICFSVLMGLLQLVFLQRYYNDIFGKGIPTLTIIKLFTWESLTIIEMVLPITLLVVATVLYRRLAKEPGFNFHTAIKKSIFALVLIGVTGFVYDAFLLPVANLHVIGLLYDIRAKAPDEPFARTNLKLFSNNYYTVNVLDISACKDSVERRLAGEKRGVASYIRAFITNDELPQFMNNDTVKAFNLTVQDIVEAQSSFSGKNRRELREMLIASLGEVNSINHAVNKYEIRKQEMFSFPFILMLNFMLGLLIGILNFRNKYLWILLISLYFSVFPGLYYLFVWFEHLSKNGTLSPFQGQFFYLVCLVMLNLLLYFYANSIIKKANSSQLP